MKTLGRYITLILMLVMLQACASTKIAEELQGGKNSFDNGNFKDAFHKLLPLASEGNAQAEYAVGYMYYYGYGITQDAESGLFWINKSAEQHYEPAIRALTLIRENKVSPEPTQQAEQDEKTDIKAQSDAVLQALAKNESTENVLPKFSSEVKEEDPEDKLSRSLPEATPEAVLPDRQQEAAVVDAVQPKKQQASAESADFNAVREKKYTLQLMGSYDLADVKNIQSHLKIAKSTYCAVTKHNGRDWYVLTYGKYSAPYLAKLAMDDLPQNVRDMKPWVRQLDGVKVLA